MTPIGYSHTQLTSSIALWAPCERTPLGKTVDVPLGPTYPTDWLGPLPSPISRVHRSELVERLVLKMRAALLNPVQVELWFGRRRVQILQTTVIEFEPDGGLNAYAWELSSGSRPCLEPRPLSFVSAVGSGHEGRWLSGFAAGLLREVRRYHYQRRQLNRVQELMPAYVMWVMDRVHAHLNQTVPLEPVHSAIEQALLSDPDAIGRPAARLGLNLAALSYARTMARVAHHQGTQTPTLKDYQECLPCLLNNA